MGRKVLISVEGQTEETFVREVLGPRYDPLVLFLQPVILKTRRVPDRSDFRGGHVSWARMKREIQALLGDTSAVAVTTLYDFYAMPLDTPGRAALPAHPGTAGASALEQAIAGAIGDGRFRPFLQVHEFEALLFADPARTGRLLGSAEQIRQLEAVRHQFGTPEDIDDHPPTSPSHRLRAIFPRYDKDIDGPLAVMEIGLEAIIGACPHFAAWVGWLDGLASA